VPDAFIAVGPHVTSFAGREAVRAIACLVLLLAPAAALGALFPLVLRLSWKNSTRGAVLGGITATNTLGAVAGSLLTGFVLLPRFGSRAVLMMLLFISAIWAVRLLAGRLRFVPLAIATLSLFLPAWDLGELATGANVYFRPSPYEGAELVWAHEAVESGLTSVIRNEAGLTMLTNGKFQGNDTGEVAAQRAFTQIPMLVKHGWRRSLLIGVGTGCSLGVLAAQPFEHVEAAELSGDVLKSARDFFGHVNEGVLAPGSRVEVHRGDGRNVLLLTDRSYDLITIELSSIWFAGASDLYNRDFYALAKRHLAPGGVLQQWVQLHHLTRTDLAVILQSIRAELPHVALFFRGSQGIVLASAEPLVIDYASLSSLSEKLRGSPATAGIIAGDLLTLHGSLILDEVGIAKLVAEEAGNTGIEPDRLESTDDSLRLEYSTPRANADDSLKADALVASLRHLAPTPLATVQELTNEQRAHVDAALLAGQGDLSHALELAERLKALPAAVPLAEWIQSQSPR